jgi:alpha-2-macroglobulin
MQHELEPGMYRVLLVKFDGRTADLGLYGLQPNGTNCFHWKDPIFSNKIPITDSLIIWQNRKGQPTTKIELPKNNPQPTTYIRKGESGLNGYVKDKNGDMPVSGAIVSIKGSNVSTLTDDNGYYEFSGIGSGEYTLEISLVGYQSLQQEIKLKQNEILTTNFLMQISEQALEEVVVVGYGHAVEKKELMGSVASVTISEFSQTLQGSVAGVSVTENGNGNEIKIRGISTLNGNNQPLYVIDGIIMEDMPENLDTTLGNISIEVLKDAAATSLYGSRGANGVILINTGRNVASSLRMNFSDYAYWQPNFTTGKDGRVKIPVSYPDNITNWQHAVYAAGPKGRYGRSITSTQAFKSVQGLLNTPSFLVEGDSSLVVGKAMNYTDAPMNIEANFAIHEINRNQTVKVPSMDAITSEYSLMAPSAPDTIKPAFSVKDAKGRTDGEQRAIPILPMGTYESEGKFFSLSSTDTSFYFSPTHKNLPVQVMATAKLIDLVEHELKILIEYPYDCLEQTANKLWGLLMLKEIASLKNQSFKYERKMSPLLNKLLSNQDKSGGWAWWPGGEPNLYITVKVLQVLRQYPQNEKIEKATRSGNLYLQNLLPRLRRFDKLEALNSLKEGGHVMPYKMAIDSIPFDSLPVHQQWQYFHVMRGHQPSYDSLWQHLWEHRKESATGATFWGNQSYLWHENKNATMVVAWKTILSDSSKHQLLPSMEKYFLEQQYDGLSNTVEKAEICHILLKEAVRKGEFSEVEPKLRFNEKEEMTSFPAFLQLSPDGQIKVEKSGYGLLYLTMFQKWQNKAPQKVDSLFDVKTTFTQFGDTVNFLKSANTATIQVAIQAKKEAQFVMVEIPLPAGCVATQKSQYPLQHREYFKDRVVIFMEKLDKGPHFIYIPIDVRYKGAYTLNPAKVELMYQPVFFGREGLRRIAIE